MKKYLLSPSIIAANLACLGEETSKVISAGADLIHFDVMDNHYVPNLTIGPGILMSLRRYGILSPFDVHLMVKPVSDQIIIDFITAGADCISFHYNATNNIEHLIDLIKNYGCKVGLVLNPNTILDKLDNILCKINLILLMSVNPGFSGQKFLPSTLIKIKQVYNLIRRCGCNNILLGVDGGITVDNIQSIANAGANMFVIGTTIFSSNNYKIIIETLRSKLLESS